MLKKLLHKTKRWVKHGSFASKFAILSAITVLLTGYLILSTIAFDPPPAKSPDINSDGTVNVLDLSILLSKWGTSGPQAADINGDNLVNVLDLSILLSNWGQVSSGTITNLPAQPFAIVYNDNMTNVNSYATPGGLVVAGRDNYQNQAFKNVSIGGGTVLIYLDPMIDNAYGRYHTLLLGASECGPAVPRWPGSPQANEWGYLADFRVGGVLQSKLECVLEKMVQENPHMGGFYADDVGSRSWYPLINWNSWSTANQQAYRDGAIELVKTFRKVANKYKLFVMVNGTWNGGSLANDGGGYPEMSKHGNALADGGYIENHPQANIPYWTGVACSTQWAARSPVTQGKAFMMTINTNAADRDAYVNIGCIAYATAQPNYGLASTPWTSFHPTGLPSKVTYPAVACGGPITITTGGTYSGCYESTDPNVPAVKISTSQPVTIDHATIRHEGIGITWGTTIGVQLTVTNSKFQALDHGSIFEQRAIDLYKPSSLVAEHNSLIDGTGIFINAGFTTVSPVRIRYNYAENIGRYPFPTSGNCCRQFVQITNATTPGMEIAWNRTKSIYGQSYVEDNINIYKTSGTAAYPIDIHHNLIDGGWPRSGDGANYTGGGILLGDGGIGSYGNTHHNRIINNANYGASITGGSNNHIFNNRTISDGKAENGATVVASYAQGFNVWDGYNVGGMTNVNAYNNVTGWWRPDGYGNGWVPACRPAGSCTGNTVLAGTITTAMEQAERDAWASDLAAAGFTVGPNW